MYLPVSNFFSEKKPSAPKGIFSLWAVKKQRSWKRFKCKLVLTRVLPVFLIILTVKVIQVFLRVKVRDIFSQAEECTGNASKSPDLGTAAVMNTCSSSHAAIPVPARMDKVRKVIIKPVTIGNQTF